MKRQYLRGTASALLLSLGIGGGVALVRALQGARGPHQTLLQRWINQALDQVLRQERQHGARLLTSQERYVIFSDHHKGARNEADDFIAAEATYLAALDHYLDQNFTLIVMGDAEDLWEERPEAVLSAYRRVFEREARFYPTRYLRVHGNHDALWKSAYQREKYLGPFFPGIEFHEGLLFTVEGTANRPGGEILLVHGHQGTLDGDKIAPLSQFLVRNVYRLFQILTGQGRTTPATDACLRARHDTMLYRWASGHEKLLLIAGHTHRPVWSSRTHLEKLVAELHRLLELAPAARPPDFAEKAARLREDIKIRARKDPPCNDSIKTRPCYFNTGCCRYADGDITGIELADGEIRLIKWSFAQGEGQRTVLESTPLSPLFYLL